MPELPEVENVRRELEEGLKKIKQLEEIWSSSKKLRDFSAPKELKKLVGQKLLKVHRKSKYLLFEWDKSWALSHLGMSGYWRFEKEYEAKKHDHIKLKFNNYFLIYNDPRRFGLFLVGTHEEIHKTKWLKNVGADPFSFEAEDTENALWLKSRKSQVPIKTWLLDQRNIGGIGNIYASEILFRANVNPFKITAKLKRDDWQRIFKQIPLVLLDSIENGGTTLKDYLRPSGEKGDFQNRLQVYDREGQKCYSCGSIIMSRQLAGRSTYWCPQCQKK